MEKEKLLEFIANAHRNTYAAPDEIRKKYKCKEPIIQGHKDYDFIEGEWRYHDSYSGTFWAPGREVVFYQGKPVWCMSYQGRVINGLTEEFIEEVYAFLKKALMNFDNRMPFRGPKHFKNNDFEYAFKLKGDYSYFTGREAIKHKGKEVFLQHVMGELIK